MGNLFDRIKQTVETFRAQLPTYDQAPTTPAQEQIVQQQEERAEEIHRYSERAIGYIDHAQMVDAIIGSGRAQRLIYIRYKGVWRHIECYELKNGKQGLLVYAWCLMDNKTHSFYLHRIQEMHTTDIPFTARFPIKL